MYNDGRHNSRAYDSLYGAVDKIIWYIYIYDMCHLTPDKQISTQY